MPQNQPPFKKAALPKYFPNGLNSVVIWVASRAYPNAKSTLFYAVILASIRLDELFERAYHASNFAGGSVISHSRRQFYSHLHTQNAFFIVVRIQCRILTQAEVFKPPNRVKEYEIFVIPPEFVDLNSL